MATGPSEGNLWIEEWRPYILKSLAEFYSTKESVSLKTSLTGFLLQGICRAKPVQESLVCAEAASSLVWEQLHAGPWKDVAVYFRELYSLSMFIKADCLRHMGDLKNAMRTVDLAILLGSRHPHGKISLRIEREIDNELCAPYNPKKRKGGPTTGDRADSDWKGSTSISFTRAFASVPTYHKSISMSKFCEVVSFRNPVVVRGALQHWRAFTPEHSWADPEYFRAIIGHRTVPVEVGTSYLEDGWSQQLMSVSEFIDKYIYSAHCPKGYLAQHEIFDHILSLAGDIATPDYCAAPIPCPDGVEESNGGVSRNIWLGPEGTISPLHQDPKHNLLCQVAGTKLVRLCSPAYTTHLYPHSKGMNTNSSQVDAENIDIDKFPLAGEIPFQDCVLEPGDMLYIPPLHWHYVRSLSYSASVSFWF